MQVRKEKTFFLLENGSVVKTGPNAQALKEYVINNFGLPEEHTRPESGVYVWGRWALVRGDKVGGYGVDFRPLAHKPMEECWAQPAQAEC